MKAAGWAGVALAGATAWSLAGVAAAECQLTKVQEFHVTMVANAPLVDAVIDGKPVRLIADLGAQKTFLTVAGAKALGASVVQTALTEYGPGGSQNAQVAHIKGLSLGGAAPRDLDIMALDAGPFPGGAIGRLGRDVLTAQDLEFDLANGAIRLFKPTGCNGSEAAYWGPDYTSAPATIVFNSGPMQTTGILSIAASLNGKPVYASINSGSQFSMVRTETAARVGMTPQSPGVTPAGFSRGGGPSAKPTPVYLASFETFSVGDETIKNPTLLIGDPFVEDKTVATGHKIATDPVAWPEIALGADFLYAHRTYIAWSRRKVYFSYTGGVPFHERIPNAAPQLSVASGQPPAQ